MLCNTKKLNSSNLLIFIAITFFYAFESAQMAYYNALVPVRRIILIGILGSVSGIILSQML